jgi:hypothetical protein
VRADEAVRVGQVGIAHGAEGGGRELLEEFVFALECGGGGVRGGTEAEEEDETAGHGNLRVNT